MIVLASVAIICGVFAAAAWLADRAQLPQRAHNFREPQELPGALRLTFPTVPLRSAAVARPPRRADGAGRSRATGTAGNWAEGSAPRSLANRTKEN